MNLYVASKAHHGKMWQSYRAAYALFGVHIISTWIDESEAGQTRDKSDLWVRCIGEAHRCDMLLAYHEEGEVWKGALVEIGAALAGGKLVYFVGDMRIGSWTNHPLVFPFPYLASAFHKIRSLAEKEREDGLSRQ